MATAPLARQPSSRPEAGSATLAGATLPDIALPFQTRASDVVGTDVRKPEPSPPSAARPAATQRSAVLVDLLMLTPPGPFGLAVEAKDDDRVVGTWQIDLQPHDAAGVPVSRASGRLHVCASRSANARSVAGFLALSEWSVGLADSEQVADLYRTLCDAVLRRFSWLMDLLPRHDQTPLRYVLFLVDSRQREHEFVSLMRLEIELLKALEEQPIRGLDLRVAHGRGTGSSAAAPTMPAALTGEPALTGSGDGRAWRGDPGVALPAPSPRPFAPLARTATDAVFVRETLSAANLRWKRKSDFQRG